MADQTPLVPAHQAVVAAVAPTSGAERAATHVVVTGAGLIKANEVVIGGLCANLVVVSDGQVEADTPNDQPAGLYEVIVGLQGSNEVIGPEFEYTRAGGGSGSGGGNPLDPGNPFLNPSSAAVIQQPLWPGPEGGHPSGVYPGS